MRILYITDPGIVGGATRSLIDVVTSMKQKGVNIVVCTSDYSALNKELSELGIENITSGHRAVMDVRAPSIKYYIKQFLKYHWYNKKAISRIENQVNVKTFDLIHTNSSRNDIGMTLSRKYGIKHICHLREFGQEDFDCWSYRWNYINYYNNYTDYFIAISNAVKNSWTAKGIAADKINVIYNGVSDESIETANIESFSDARILKMVIVGGVCSPKGQDQIIEALNLLPNEIRNNVQLDIIGWGEDQFMSKLKNKIEEYGLTQQVHMLGAKKNIGSLLRNYHIGLMCSRSEGFGRVTAEYMHAGLGVIASDAGANPEIIEQQVCGLLYHLGDYHSFAHCIERYYNDRDLLMSMAKAGQIKAQKQYTKELNANAIFEFYKSMIYG